MKKVLVAGAALLIAGSMVSTASAEVNLSGDARVRYVGTSDYGRDYVYNPVTGTVSEDQNGYRDNFNSRIRVKFDAKSKGGAFMKARVRFDDFTWDGQGWGMASEDKNVWADYAFIGVPIGAGVLTGGRMPGNFSKFFAWDTRPTRVKYDWKSGNFRLIGLVDVKSEFADSIQDEWNDEDFMAYGLIPVVKFNDDWSAKVYFRYQDDQRGWDVDEYSLVRVTDTPYSNDPGAINTGSFVKVPNPDFDANNDGHTDRSGFLGSIEAKGKIAMVGVEGGIAYKEAEVLSADPNADDGWGWHLEGSMDMGAFRPALVIGGTYDGYQTDPDFGFIMIGADEPITVISTLGGVNSDSIFAALTSSYAMSDQLKFAGNLVYYDIDLNSTEATPDVRGLADAWEISGSATYTISEGADLTYKLGYLSPSYDGRINSAGISDDGYFGHYLRMAIKF